MLRLAAILTLCVTTALAAENAAPGAHPDLKLEVYGSKQVAAGASVELKMHLLNTTKDKIVHVVKPGDGSESGWREPHVFYTAEVKQPDGTWAAAKRNGIGRCGLYNPKWQNDVVELKPGEKLELKDWILPVERVIELKQPGSYRVQVHYSYREGKNAKGLGGNALALPETLKDVNAYEVVSENFELEVVAAQK